MVDMGHRTLFCHILPNYVHYATFMSHLYKTFAATFLGILCIEGYKVLATLTYRINGIVKIHEWTAKRAEKILEDC